MCLVGFTVCLGVCRVKKRMGLHVKMGPLVFASV